MGGWKVPAPHVPAPTNVLVEISIPHLVGDRLSLKAAWAGKPLEFEVPDNRGAGGGRATACADVPRGQVGDDRLVDERC